MKKIRLNELSEPVRSFIDEVKGGESIMVVDENGQLQCGITPYFEASPAERERAWERLRELQKRADASMKKHGKTEDDVMQVILEDD